MKKEFYLPYFESKRITVMGLGLLGRGIGDTRFLAKQGAFLVVTDKKSEHDLVPSLEALKDCSGITYHLGEHVMGDFENCDFVLKAAGVPLDSKYVARARECGIPVYMSAALVVSIVKKYLPATKIVGVTGTRGKSTTTELIACILEHNGFRVHRGGNIRGVANLPLLEKIENGDVVVMELDSWQLQGFDELRLSPDIAVFTSFLDDHLNYYKGDKELYFRDKASIYLHQKDGVLIASKQAAEEIRKRHSVDMIVPEKESFDTHLIGVHNEVSLSLASAVAKSLHVSKEGIRNAVKTFKAVQGRLEHVGVFRNVHVYNDNNATTPDAAIAGIEAICMKYGKKPILICGGSDKGIPLFELEKKIDENTKACVLLAGTGTDRLSIPKKHLHEKLEDCIQNAFDLAEDEDIILFSPGFASFSAYFRNEYEKNDLFIKIVKSFK